MTDLQKTKIGTLRSQGVGYAAIAKAVVLKKGAVVDLAEKWGRLAQRLQTFFYAYAEGGESA